MTTIWQSAVEGTRQLRRSIKKIRTVLKRAVLVFLRCTDLSSLIFPGSHAFVFLKSTYKITQIIKAVAIGNIRYGIVCGGKLVAGLLNALAVQIVHRSLMGHFRKEAAEILGGHGYGI